MVDMCRPAPSSSILPPPRGEERSTATVFLDAVSRAVTAATSALVEDDDDDDADGDSTFRTTLASAAPYLV